MGNPQKQPVVVKPPAPGAPTKLTLPYTDSIATDVDVFTISNTLGEGQSNADISRLSTIVGGSTIAHGVHGVNGNGSGGAPPFGTGVWGESDNGFGVYGASVSNSGVQGISSTLDGLKGVSGSDAHAGVSGVNTKGAYGVWGYSSVAGESAGIGVYGEGGGVGVMGVGSGGAMGVSGQSTLQGVGGSGGSVGVYGTSDGQRGVNGHTLDGTAVIGEGNNGSGVWGTGGQYGIYGESQGGYAGYFKGKVQIVGGPLLKPGGGFKIDHPSDPANKYLSHAFVESSEMKNIYDGTALLDPKGETLIELPAWFEALNRDFRYQLTAIGQPAAGLHVAEELREGRFKVAGGVKGMKVSWQVTGIRKDPWAVAHQFEVEEGKAGTERGHYLHPDLHGAPEDKGMAWARTPDLMRIAKTPTPNPFHELKLPSAGR